MEKRKMLANAIDVSGFNRLLNLTGAWQGLLVLNYHRIGTPGGSSFDWELWSASEEEFDAQVKYLASNFDLISVSDLRQVLARPKGRSVMITFDDGYRDNYEVAFPILRSYGAAATFFLTTGFLDGGIVPWWDEVAWMIRKTEEGALNLHGYHEHPIFLDEPDRCDAIHKVLMIYKSLRGEEADAFLDVVANETGSGRCPEHMGNPLWMTWDMVREMRQGGMSIGSHTVMHPVLARQTTARQDWEIGQSKRRIEEEIGESISALSYPIGKACSYNDITLNCLERHGYHWAFTYSGGYAKPGSTNCFSIPRVAVESDTSMATLRTVAALPQIFS